MRISRLLPAALLAAASLHAQTPDLYDQGTLRSIYLTFSSPTWLADLIASRASGKYISASMIVDQQLYQQIGVKMSGRDSFDGTPSDKKDLEISTDAFVSGQSLLGYDKLNLHNGFNDPTMLREVLGYEVLRKFMPAPKANHVKVYINNVYWGLYINVQQVDKDLIKAWFKGKDGNRYLAEATTPAGKGWSALQNQGTLLQPYMDAYAFKGDLSQAVKPWEDVRQLCQVLDTSNQLSVDLPAIADVDGMLWYLALFSAFANLEGYNPKGEDYYLYHDEEHDLMHILPWDMTGAFGASGGQTILQATDQPLFLNEAQLSLPLLGKLWGEAEWRARYVHHVKKAYDEGMAWSRLSASVNRLSSHISAALQADTKKLYSFQQATDNLTKAVAINTGSYAKSLPGLKQFCDTRGLYLAAQPEFKAVAPVLTRLQLSDSNPKPTTVVTVTVQVQNPVAQGPVQVYYRGIGGFVAAPMFDDGQHGDGGPGDGVFGAFIPATVQTPGAEIDYYVGARSAAAAGGAVDYLPAAGQREPASYTTQWAVGSSPVHINEFMADNATTIQDGAGEFDDWVELYNAGATAVPVGGMFLTDDNTKPTKWEIPANTSIGPGQSLLIWCDEDGSQGPMHANFKLSAQGEEISLFDRDGKTRLSRIVFGPMATDESIGCREDGAALPLARYQKWTGGAGAGPTPGQPNEPGSGTREYWSLGASNHRLFLQMLGSLQINTNNALRILGAPANTPVAMMLAAGTGEIAIGPGLDLLLGGPLIGPYIFQSDATGSVVQVVPFPNDPTLVGRKVYLQAGATDSQGFTLSNASQVIPR